MEIRKACGTGIPPAFFPFAPQKKSAGKMPAPQKSSLKNCLKLTFVVRFRKGNLWIDDRSGQGFHRKIHILWTKQFLLCAALRFCALLFLPFHFFLALLKRGFRRSHTHLLVWKRVRTARVVKERIALHQRGSRGCRGLSR